MNPITRQPWVLSDAARREITHILRRDSRTRTLHTGFLVAQIDATAGDYRRRLRLWNEIDDAQGPNYDLVRRRAKQGRIFAASALEMESYWQFRRGRGRPPATREKAALVFGLARLWPNRLTLSPRSSFVRVLGIVLADCGTRCKNPYRLAERINKTGVPPVYRLEPVILEGFRAE